eukprot:43425-Pelagomonas_calceolata.AAC.4
MTAQVPVHEGIGEGLGLWTHGWRRMRRVKVRSIRCSHAAYHHGMLLGTCAVTGTCLSMRRCVEGKDRGTVPERKTGKTGGAGDLRMKERNSYCRVTR